MIVSAASGPAVARWFHRLLAAIFIVAFVSLARQQLLLIGAHGIDPLTTFVDLLRAQGGNFFDFPTLFWFAPSDLALNIGAAIGIIAASLALIGVWPRALIGVCTILYLSAALAGRTFFAFQWDNLLIECGVFAVLLSRTRSAPAIHLLFRLLLIKLYFESGIAKWQSGLHDWQDGSAMTFYYETAPLPTWVALYAHALPRAWHHFESWFTLFFEIVVPFFALGPRRARRFALVILTFFQLANILTANYGFFCYLALALHVFLLDERDVTQTIESHTPSSAWQWVVVGAFALLSLNQGVGEFGPGTPLRFDLLARLRIVNTYHLFGSITRERIEPQFETFDGTTWTELDMWHKPGDVHRRPDFAQPLQPRVDFQLWFYGLAYQSRPPVYVAGLVEKLCTEPRIVQPLFRTTLAPHPTAVRIRFWRYHFAAPREKGLWWHRTLIDETHAIDCTTP